MDDQEFLRKTHKSLEQVEAIAYAWEPVLVVPARKRSCDLPTVRDYVSCNITLKRGVSGAKPEGFCFWLFDILGLQPEDDFVDIFPGSGAVSDALSKWKSQRTFFEKM